MVAMGGRRPPWLVGASLTFPLDCSIANYYSRLRSFWYKKKKRVITHLERVITHQREKINRFRNCSSIRNCYGDQFGTLGTLIA